jgi:hypothetical protein
VHEKIHLSIASPRECLPALVSFPLYFAWMCYSLGLPICHLDWIYLWNYSHMCMTKH